jgi:hypothetical protein
VYSDRNKRRVFLNMRRNRKSGASAEAFESIYIFRIRSARGMIQIGSSPHQNRSRVRSIRNRYAKPYRAAVAAQ